MNVIIMGEESQEIAIAFRAKGHNAYSSDLQDCSGGHPEWHIKGDMWEAFYGKYHTGLHHVTEHPHWDMAIIHITCTFMCNSGALRLYKGGKKINGIDEVRWMKMIESTKEFNRGLALPVGKLVMENPIMHCHARERISANWNQTIQPYEYGHPETKRTCLWVKGLPLLKPTNILPFPENGRWENQSPSGNNNLGKGKGKQRSKTYLGWAQAMAEQWG